MQVRKGVSAAPGRWLPEPGQQPDWPPGPCDQLGRIRGALGLRGGELPRVEINGLRRYYQHLRTHLVFPFLARYPDIAAAPRLHAEVATITALIDPDTLLDPENLGLVCRALCESQAIMVPLVDLELGEGHPNHQLIEDYWYWYWNWRFDPRI